MKKRNSDSNIFTLLKYLVRERDEPPTWLFKNKVRARRRRRRRRRRL